MAFQRALQLAATAHGERERLGVEPADCLFVGDGANDELPGAERVGKTAVQLRPSGEELTESGKAWQGPSIERLAEVLDLA